MGRLISVVAIVALGAMGLAPVVVCAMPPGCPMWQTRSSDCCTAVAPPDGVAQAPCHPQTISAMAAPLTNTPQTLGAATFVATIVPAPPVASLLPALPAPPAAVPRFLLSCTFRL